MKPIHQTKFGPTDGNCLAACLASIFEVHIDSITSFGRTPAWYEEFEHYMMSTFKIQPVDLNISSLEGWTPKGYYLVAGKSPRGNYDHSIVAKDGKLVHDPFPSGHCELASVDTYTIFLAMLI